MHFKVGELALWFGGDFPGGVPSNDNREIFLVMCTSLVLVYQAKPSFATAIMPFQHTWGKEGLADVIYIADQSDSTEQKSTTSDTFRLWPRVSICKKN